MLATPEFLVRLRDRILRIGARATDPPDTRLRKESLVLIVATICLLATIWTLTYLFLGLPVAAAVPFSYQLISVVSLAYFARTGNFNVFRLVQVGSMLILPFALQWSVGGFENSSAVMVWAFAAPLGALVYGDERGAGQDPLLGGGGGKTDRPVPLRGTRPGRVEGPGRDANLFPARAGLMPG